MGFEVEGTLFDDATRAIIESFQRSRGLEITGVVDVTTWECLEEATWKLGTRLIFLARPYLRGDDVAELQLSLAQLGFSPGRIDGIFGSQSYSALCEFQANVGLAASGELDRATWMQLRRVSTVANRPVVGEIDVEPLGTKTLTIAVVGDAELTSLLSVVFQDAGHHVLRQEGLRSPADFANTHRANLVISCVPRDDERGIHLHYWAGYSSHSRRGEQLASAIASELVSHAQLPRVEVTGMALPILRETKMTTVHVEVGLDAQFFLSLIMTAISKAVGLVFHNTDEK